MNGFRQVLANISFGAFFLAMCGCTSYDYGSTGDYFYQVPDPENPVWNEGISELVEKKCGTCHSPANPWYKPQNVPELPSAQNPIFGLNFISQEGFFDGLNPLLPLVKKCIESTCGKDNIPMPPTYASPLNDAEKKALIAYITPKIPVVVSSLSDSFKSVCSGCHGSDGKSGYAPKLGSKPYTVDEFKKIITNGTGTMGAQAGYDLSKADGDHAILYQ